MLLLFISLVLCAGCSPSKRLARLLRQHPELKAADTVTVRDTIAVPEVSADTAVPVNHFPDTVAVEKGRLEVRIRKLHDTLFIRGKCKADTVIVQKKIPVEKIVLAESHSRWFLWIIIGLVVGMVFVLIVRRT